jgi:hypothetical protein
MVRTTPREIRAAALADAGRCIAVGGHGVPDGAVIAEAMRMVSAVAVAVRAIKRKGGHEFKPGEPEVRLLAPARGGRGGARWTVSVRVPAFVSPRDVREAAERTSSRHPGAKAIRLVAVDPAAVPAARPGRDRLPSHIRETRTRPQHRGRELR